MSTLCSVLREAIEGVLKTRAAYLERALRELLDDEDGTGLTKSVFNHPLFSGLFLGKYVPKPAQAKLSVLANGRGLPSYVPASSFAKALLDLAARGPTGGDGPNRQNGAVLTVESLRARLTAPQSPIRENVRRVLLQVCDTARGDLEQVEKNLEDWFNGSMERASGWYKRSTQWVVFVVAVLVTVLGNVDSIAIAKHFYRDEAALSAAVAVAKATVTDETAPDKKKAREVLQQLELPVGWDFGHLPEGSEWFNHALGWLLTAFAATLGAPFWFDVLNKVMVIRSTVKPHEKSPEEASKDAQAPPPVVHAAGAAPSAVANATVAAAGSAENELDCCGGGFAELTDDQHLPAATGGVQS